MDRIIRIDAVSNIYEFHQEVPEKKAEAILRTILKSFKTLEYRCRGKMQVTPLSVTTFVKNPTLY